MTFCIVYLYKLYDNIGGATPQVNTPDQPPPKGLDKSMCYSLRQIVQYILHVGTIVKVDE